jgi:hypothetical protein
MRRYYANSQSRKKKEEDHERRHNPQDPLDIAHLPILRHACGFARALQANVGHKNLQHTVRYTELSPDRFRDFWR